MSRSDTSTLAYTINIEVPPPATIQAGELTLDDMGPLSILSVDDGTRKFVARQSVSPRDSREFARLIIDEATPPSDGDPCNGRFKGVLTVGMAEIINVGTPNEALGPGRVLLSAAFQ